MRKLLFSMTTLVLLAFGSTAIAQEGGTVEVEKEITDGPVIELDKDFHDYGQIKQGDNGECVFKVTNTGNQPLIISMCKGSCGCTVPQCPKEPIAPGATKEITVKYNTNRVGPINKSVTISSNAANAPRKVIRIKGQVKAKPEGGAPVNTGIPANN